MNNIISFNSQQSGVHNERSTVFKDKTNENQDEVHFTIFHQLKIPRGRYLHHIIRQDNITTHRVIYIVLSNEMIPLLLGSFLFVLSIKMILPLRRY